MEERDLGIDGLNASRSIIDRVQLYTRQFPERRLMTWLDAKCREEKVFTYADFDESARRLAAYLLGQGLERGDHVILGYPPGFDFYLAFWACSLCGLIPVPVNPPFSDIDAGKFLSVCQDSDSVAVLTDQLYSRLYALKLRKSQVERFGKRVASVFGQKDTSEKPAGFGALEELRWINTSGRGEVYASLQLEPRGIDETAFIMYSSGSTASPKGALTSFGNMHHQFEMIALSLDAREQPVNCWWAPHFHDFGLLSGFLNTLHQGGHCVVTSPMYFIQRPAIWLDMLHKYSATHTFGPDFGYQLLVKRTTAEERASGKWDLRSLRVAMSAAEKVRDSTLNQFHAAFADCGFRPETFCPAYGLAEHTVGVTINGVGCPVEVIEFLRDPLEEEGRAVRASEGEGRQERTMRLVGCGTPWNDIDLRIVGLDDEGHPQGELGPDQVGEVWVASGSKTLGYYNLPELSKEVFEATLPGDASGSANYYLRTGDYGFVEQVTGELFICGRKKDMVIIAGKNHYSEDLELTASTLASDHIRPGRIAAFSTEEDDSGSEVLILVGEVRSAEQVNRRDAFRALNDCIAAEHKVAVDKIVLIDPGTIPKTTSGKLRRFLIREQLLDGALSVIAGGTWIRPQSSEDSQQEAEGARPELEGSQQETIAVVGNCLGSLTAAWKLAQSGRRVTLYHEFNQVQSDGSAFWTLSKDLSPNLAELVKTAGIKLTRSSDGGASGIGYFNVSGGRYDLSPGVLGEAQRFQRELIQRYTDPESDGRSVGELIETLGLSREFVSTYFMGLMSPFDPGHPIRTYLSYPARLVGWIWLCTQHHLESTELPLYHLEHGLLRDALRRLLSETGSTITEFRSLRVTQATTGRIVMEGQGVDGRAMTGEFSSLLVGGSPEEAQRLLGENGSPTYRKLLSEFESTVVHALVHRASEKMPNSVDSWKSINLFLPEVGSPLPALDEVLTTTLIRHPPESEGEGEPVYMTYNAERTKGWTGHGDVFQYTHVALSPKTQRLRYSLRMAQGQDGIYFCGAWLSGLSLAEDGIVAALEAVNSVMDVDEQVSILEGVVPSPPPFETCESESIALRETAAHLGLARDLLKLLKPMVPESIPLEIESALQPILSSEAVVATLLDGLGELELAERVTAAEVYGAETVGELARYLHERECSGALSEWESVDVVLEPTVSREQPFSNLGSVYPVSYAQESILVSHFLNGQQSHEWNVPLAMWFLGDYCVERLQQALAAIAERHKALKTTFHPLADGTFGQRIHEALPPDYFRVNQVNSREEAIAAGEDDARLPMDITQGVWRVIFSCVSPSEAALTMVVHHAVFDGASLGVFFEELRTVYAELESGHQVPQEPDANLPLEFIDFAHWQRRKSRFRQFDPELLYWQRHLAEPLRDFQFQDEHRGWETPELSSKPMTVTLKKESLDSLRHVGRQVARTSVNVVLMTAYAEILGAVCDVDEVLVRFPTAARPPGTESMIGCFAEAMVVRLPTDSSKTFAEAVTCNHRILYEAFLHPAPFYLISERLRLDQGALVKLNRVVLNWEQTTAYTRMDKRISERVTTEPFNLNPDEIEPMAAVQSMLNLNIDEAGSMHGKWFMDSALLKETTRRLVGESFERLLAAVVETSGDIAISDMLTQDIRLTSGPDVHVTAFDSERLLGGRRER